MGHYGRKWWNTVQQIHLGGTQSLTGRTIIYGQKWWNTWYAIKVFPGISLTVFSEQVMKDRSNPELRAMWPASGYASMHLGWSTGLCNKSKLTVSQSSAHWAGRTMSFEDNTVKRWRGQIHSTNQTSATGERQTQRLSGGHSTGNGTRLRTADSRTTTSNISALSKNMNGNKVANNTWQMINK